MKSMMIALVVISSVSFANGAAEASDRSKKTVAFSLVAVDGQDGGYCVLKSSEDSVDLITIEGALSEKQLKQALRYMSYRAQWLNSSFFLITPLPAGEVLSFVGGSVYPAMTYFKEQESPVAATVQMLAGGWFGPIVEFMHRRDRFSAITDKGSDFTQKSEWDKWGRLPQEEDLVAKLKINFKAMYGENSTLGIGEVKGEKIIERLQIEPEFPGECDHLNN